MEMMEPLYMDILLLKSLQKKERIEGKFDKGHFVQGI